MTTNFSYIINVSKSDYKFKESDGQLKLFLLHQQVVCEK